MSYSDIFANELELKLRGGANLYDVRERDEYEGGHIPGAVNIPLSELPGRLDEIQSPAVMVCLSGGRSSQAAAYLTQSGRQDVMNLMGGTVGWMKEGRSVHFGQEP